VAIVALNLGLSLAIQQFGLESASHSIVQSAQSSPEVLLVLVPLSYLVIGPGEELLYRNVVQKSLYGAFSRPGAVIVGSVVFAAVHVFAFSGPGQSALATLNTLAVVFVLSLVLGAVYEQTENVVASALVHGTFDAIAFAATYVQLTGGV
ncbi:MAG: CPBP family intramembrane glutamic endopeptidase, partial [Halobacteriales archaeon]|nr:CPBP family intramembrane glutamic endopeptidase [Halobacteriales archaeon]